MKKLLPTFHIGEAASASGLHAKMIRHYESIGLMTQSKRTDAGYRVYDQNDIHSLRFIKKARALGFSMQELKKLMSLWRNKRRASADVKALALSHVESLEQKIVALQEMRDALQHLVKNCRGDQRPECPILFELTGGKCHSGSD